MPAVTSLGEFVTSGQKRRGATSRAAGSDRRLPWETLFYNRQLDIPLVRNDAAEYAPALELVRLGPSASNKQPCLQPPTNSPGAFSNMINSGDSTYSGHPAIERT